MKGIRPEGIATVALTVRSVAAFLALSACSITAQAESWQGVGEMPLDYRAYVRDFNTGDDRGLVEKYFSADTQMISGSGVREGHKGMNEFLAWAHDGVREIIRPQVVMWDKDHIFAEVDINFRDPYFDIEHYLSLTVTKPNGQPRRSLDVSRAEEQFGFRAQTSFDIGLSRTIAWYEDATSRKARAI